MTIQEYWSLSNIKIEYIGEDTIHNNRSEQHNTYIRINGKNYTFESFSDSTLPRGHQLCLELERILKDAFKTS